MAKPSFVSTYLTETVGNGKPTPEQEDFAKAAGASLYGGKQAISA
jgi:hypothetical protein